MATFGNLWQRFEKFGQLLATVAVAVAVAVLFLLFLPFLLLLSKHTSGVSPVIFIC